MKKLSLLLLLSFILWSCTSHKPVNHNYNTPADSVEHESHSDEEKLVLNNGLKWKADEITDHNVRRLLAIADKINDSNDNTLLMYRNIQGNLQAGIDTMIAQCKMKGPDHLALHKWLEPLMAQIVKLKNVTNISDARLVMKAIKKQAGLYTQYFEVSTDDIPDEKKL